MAAAVLWLSCVQTVTAHLPCARMPPKEQDAATIISAMFRGNDEGLRDIFATAAADSGACFVDVVLPRDAPPAFEVSARSLVDEAAALLVPAAPGVRGIRIAPHSSDHDDVLAGAAMTWGRRGQRCEWQGYHIIMEDGIRYPDDYLEVARGAVDSTGRRAMVGFQGFVWVSEFLKLGAPYLQTTYGLPASGLSGEADSDVWVDVLRLGTTAYHAQLAAHTHTSLTPPKSFDTAAASAAPDTGASATISAQTGWIEPAWFLGSSDSGMQDILLAVQAHYRNVPRLLCSHPADWLTPRPAPVALQQASWWWERNTFPALRPPARSPEPGALEATASEKKAMRLALQFAPWRVLTLDDLPGSFVLRQHTHRLADGSGRATVDFEMLPVDALVFSSVTGLGAEQDRTGADEGADEEFDGAEEDGDGEGTEGTTGGGSEADLQGFTLLVPVYWKTRVRFLQGTLQRLVHMAEVARIIVLWNNPMWPLPPCLLCETEEGLGGGDGVGGDSRSGGEQVSALWEAGGKVVVVLPPCSAESGYASASLNNRFLPYSLIMTEAVLSMDDDFRPTPTQMRELLRTWRAFPHKLVGPMWLVTRSLACRNGEDLGGGAGSWRTDGAVDAPASEVQCSDLVYVTGGWPGYYNVLLTGFAAFHRGWLALYSSDEAGEQGLAAARALVDEQSSCEDILLNFLAASRGAGAPVAVDVGHVNEFDDGGGLSALGSHFAARSRCATSFAAIFRASGAQGLEEGVGRKRNLAFPRADVSGMFRECRWDDLLGRRICTGAFNASRYAVAEAALLDAEGGSAARVRRQMLLMLRDSWDTAALVDGRGCAGVAVGQEEGGGGEALWERTAEDLVTDERPDDVMHVPTLGEKQETMNLGPIVRSQGVVGGAEGETEERVVVVVTVAYNNELMLVKQVETLERFMSDHFHMMVAVDSSTALQRAGMHAHCSRLALECHDTPFSDADDEFEAHDRPSWSHMRALNWLLHTHVFPDFGDEALLLVLDPDVFLLRPFSMRHFACLGGVSCGLAPGGGSRDMMQVQACHLSGIRQDMSQQVFGGESPYLHVAVLMMDLRELPGLRALSLNPWRFDGVHCDSGCGLLDYLYCLGHRDSGPTLLLPAPPPSRLHDSGTQVGGSGPMERESSARQWERFLEARAALLRDGSSKKRVLEYPVDKAHWWSDGVVDAPAEAARGISEDSSAHARAAGPAAAESAAERVPELVVCYLEHGYLGMRGVVNEHGSSGDLPVKAAVGVDGDDVEGSDMSADVGWCVLEGGVCAAGSPGGSEACHQGLPDTLGGGVWMHSRRSSDWDLPRHQVHFRRARSVCLSRPRARALSLALAVWVPGGDGQRPTPERIRSRQVDRVGRLGHPLRLQVATLAMSHRGDQSRPRHSPLAPPASIGRSSRRLMARNSCRRRQRAASVAHAPRAHERAQPCVCAQRGRRVSGGGAIERAGRVVSPAGALCQ